jgi:tRNA(fMet)-specific endonuclease VapC
MSVRLLDTNIVSYIMKFHPLWARYSIHLTGYDLASSFQTLAELLEGGVLAGWNDVKWAMLETTLATMTILDSDLATCERWAEIRAARRARPIGAADCWIAATALAYNLELVTHNPSDFSSIPGLSVITEAP